MKAHTYTVIQTQEITAGKHIVDIRASWWAVAMNRQLHSGSC
jgi:hypothetical protein